MLQGRIFWIQEGQEVDPLSEKEYAPVVREEQLGITDDNISCMMMLMHILSINTPMIQCPEKQIPEMGQQHRNLEKERVKQ